MSPKSNPIFSLLLTKLFPFLIFGIVYSYWSHHALSFLKIWLKSHIKVWVHIVLFICTLLSIFVKLNIEVKVLKPFCFPVDFRRWVTVQYSLNWLTGEDHSMFSTISETVGNSTLVLNSIHLRLFLMKVKPATQTASFEIEHSIIIQH